MVSFRSRSMAATVGAVAVTAAVTASIAASPANVGHGPSGNTYREVRLVADTPGQARITDPNLVNPWGLAESPSSPLWVANNATSTSTLYQGATSGTARMPYNATSGTRGMPYQGATSPKQFMKVPLDVRIPGGGAPTGVVFNPTERFTLSTGGKSGPALFVFAGENGDLSAWNRSGDPTKAVLVAHTDHAVYKGLTIVTVGGKPYLLVANFQRDRVDVFNDHFQHVSVPHAFSSEHIPDGYAPFNIANLDGRVYVTYAKQDAKGEDDVAGPGNGFVNVFDQRGRFLDSLLRRGVLDAPWGVTIAPQGFGAFAGKLLVGNFGDGRIHVVDQRDGRVIATLRDRAHKPIEIEGLWGLLPGNGTAGDRSAVWFSAGPDDESHGLLGILSHH